MAAPVGLTPVWDMATESSMDPAPLASPVTTLAAPRPLTLGAMRAAVRVVGGNGWPTALATPGTGATARVRAGTETERVRDARLSQPRPWRAGSHALDPTTTQAPTTATAKPAPVTTFLMRVRPTPGE